MKKLSDSLTESRFVDLINKKFTGERRKEDGIKVKTCLNTEIFLKNPKSDYNGLIEYMFRYYSNLYHLAFSIKKIPKDVNFEDLKNFKIPYKYLVYESKVKYKKSLMCEFVPYSKYEDELEDKFKIYDESDYNEICRSISEKIKEAGEMLVYVYESFNDDIVDADKYDYVNQYNLLLIDSDTEYNLYYKYVSDDTDYREMLKADIKKRYPELKDTYFIFWMYPTDIAIPLNINNLNNIKEYCEYAKKWFSSRRNQVHH